MIKEEYINIPETEFVPLKEGVDSVFWGKYEINKLGIVKDLTTLVTTYSKTRVTLRTGKFKKSYSINRLLGETFLIKPEECDIISSINGESPCLDNLRWITRSDLLRGNPKKKEAKKWKGFNTLPDFQNFINKKNLNSPKDFKDKYPGLYYRASHILKLTLSELEYPNRKNTDWSYINNLNDILDFIKKNKISKDQLIKNYDGLLQRLRKRDIYLSDIFPDETRYLGHKLEYFDSLEKFQEFIIEADIKSSDEFYKQYGKLYRRSLHYGKLDYHRSIRYRGEEVIKGILDDLGIEYIHDKSARFLTGKSRLDFRLDKYKIIIEYQGTQHFLDSEWNTFDSQYKLDKKKRDECINAGYTVIYVIFDFLDKDRYNKINFNDGNYLGKIFHNKEDLIEFLKTIK